MTWMVVSDLLVSWTSAMHLLSVCGGCGRFPGLRGERAVWFGS